MGEITKERVKKLFPQLKTQEVVPGAATKEICCSTVRVVDAYGYRPDDADTFSDKLKCAVDLLCLNPKKLEIFSGERFVGPDICIQQYRKLVEALSSQPTLVSFLGVGAHCGLSGLLSLAHCIRKYAADDSKALIQVNILDVVEILGGEGVSVKHGSECRALWNQLLCCAIRLLKPKAKTEDALWKIEGKVGTISLGVAKKFMVQFEINAYQQKRAQERTRLTEQTMKQKEAEEEQLQPKRMKMTVLPKKKQADESASDEEDVEVKRTVQRKKRYVEESDSDSEEDVQQEEEESDSESEGIKQVRTGIRGVAI